MKCEFYIKNNLCLGCSLAEENIEAEDCKYRDKSDIEKCITTIAKSKQIKLY